jgi:hypothetical protein
LSAPSEVFAPSAFSQPRRATQSGGSQPTGRVAPSGFRTLSTLCSPRDLPGLFHPGPAPGVRSSRPCSARDAVRRFRRRAPPGVPYLLRRAGPPLQGSCTSHEARPRYPGFSQAHRAACLHELHPLRGFLPPAISGPVRPPSPLTCFFGSAFTLTSPPAPQGFCRRRRSRSLSRSARPPWSFLPR